ncbi:ATP synthase F0 subunit B [Patescibacteria group bacterium]|nr:MAG: ATP synthase F0 subunit B [Patescibacteria group bacterium]
MGELFSTFGLDVRLLVIQSVNFGITLLVLWYFLYRPLLKIMAERKEKIAKGVQDAEEAERTRKSTEDARSGILTSAEQEAANLMDRAVGEGKDERAKIVKMAQERSDALVADARAEALELQRKALQDSEKEVTRMAILAAEKILSTQK